MPTFTVSLIASIPVSAQVVIEADTKEQALAIAQQMHSRAQLGWTYNGLPIPAFTGPVASIWSNPGVIPQPGPKKVNIVLAVNPTTVPFGSPVICTATIAPGATGLVSFYDGLTLIGTATPNGFGVATLSGIDLPIGIQQIVAKFAGDTYFAEGTSNTVPVTVTPPATATVCVGSPDPQDFGSVVNISATTTSGFGVPTGLILFYDGATQIGSAALVGGTCSINTAALLVGSHQLTAVYQGSPSFAGSTSPVFIETIQAVNIPTMTVVVSDQPSAPRSTLVTFTATVSSLAGPPSTGTVTFLAIPMSGPTVPIGSPVNVNGSGVASISTSTLLSGVYTIQATYNGSSGFLSSVGTCAQDILAAAPTEAITITPPGPNGYVSNIGVNVTVHMTLSGVPTPTGTVTLYAGSTAGWPGDAVVVPGGSSLPLSGGVHNYVTPVNGAPSVNTVGYTYSGDGYWAATTLLTSPTATLTSYSDLVTENPWTISPDTWPTGDTGSSALAITVNPPPNGLISSSAGVTPTGDVQLFYLLPSESHVVPYTPFPALGTTAPLSGGIASTTLNHTSSPWNGSPNTIYLAQTYSGDSNYLPNPPVTAISNCTNNGGLIQVTTSTPHNLNNGSYVAIFNVVGATEANGWWPGIAIVDSSNFTLSGSAFTNAYVSGGTAQAMQLTIVNATNNGGLIEIQTQTPHSFVAGSNVAIANVSGTTEANGNWTVGTVIDATHFTLSGSAFVNPYSGQGNAWLLNSITIAPLLVPFVDPSWSALYIKDDGSQSATQTAHVSNSCSLFGYTVGVTNGLNTVSTTGDLSSFFVSGTQIVFAGDGTGPYTVQSINSSQITLTTTFTGTTNAATTAAYNAPQPTGTFQFTVNGTNFSTPVGLTGSPPSATSTAATGGSAPLTPDGNYSPGGTYSGDSIYQSSGPNGPSFSADMTVYNPKPSMSLSTQLVGTFNVQNGQTVIPTSVSQVGVFAGGEEVQFSSQPGHSYQVSSAGLTSAHITLNSAYTGTNNSAAIATIPSQGVQASSGENIPLLAFLGCNQAPFGPTPTGTIQMYLYNTTTLAWESTGSWGSFSPATLSPNINTFAQAQSVTAANSSPPFNSSSPGTYFSYSFTSGDSHYNNVPAPAGGPPPTNGDVNYAFQFHSAG
jgi:hypothetical protein